MSPTVDQQALSERIPKELESLTAIRRDLHAHPELRFEEQRTSKRVQDELGRLGIRFVAGLGGPARNDGTGVLAHIPATVDDPGPCVGLRADMDALPITERTGKRSLAYTDATIDGEDTSATLDGNR
ncbi:MAG: hypothetical protein AAGA55_07265, partial [Planctomycetota bacterium]